MNIQTKIEKSEGEAAYERDFALWASEQARLLREGRLSDLDIENLVEEVDSLGRSQRTELRKRLATLIEHLIKYQYSTQTDPLAGWEITINLSRDMIDGIVEDSPSLGPVLPEIYEKAWTSGRTKALGSFFKYERARYVEHEQKIPKLPSLPLGDVLSEGFLPERSDT